MENLKFAFIKAQWHGDIVDECYKSCKETIAKTNPNAVIDAFDVPGAFEIPLLAQDLARTGKYDAIICSAFIVNGGIYHHDFVSDAVINGFMRVQLDTGVPVISAALTPHNYQPSDELHKFFFDHFKTKGKEAAEAALSIVKTRAPFIEKKAA